MTGGRRRGVLLLATAQATYGIYFDSNGKPTPAKISW